MSKVYTKNPKIENVSTSGTQEPNLIYVFDWNDKGLSELQVLRCFFPFADWIFEPFGVWKVKYNKQTQL